ncbi:hypothetical protein [Dyella subtropica]|uniref:hypothetical protein n=1 Tax=Dyella subtropica TaxID=2992127 RepID=UPI00225707CF|nr:hypothetical protein [Dyella subtropica]
MDLRTTVGAVVRLPYDPDRLVEILCETEPTAANDSTDEDHPTFWLIVADQFAKRGIVCDHVREKAFQIIDNGADIAMLQKAGMSESGLRKRGKQLQELRTRIAAANVQKPRAVLKKPQPLLMDVGDVIVYPTRRGDPINPYFATVRMTNGRPWIPDGWGAAVIIDCGRAFEFLSWYRPLTVAEARSEKPPLDLLRGDVLWRLRRPGTCSAPHFQRMELEKVGNLAIDPMKLKDILPQLFSAIPDTVSDISLANRLSADPHGEEPTIQRGKQTLIMGIEQMLYDEHRSAT